MNNSTAKKLRKLLSLDINAEREQFLEQIGIKNICVISPDGNHSIREESVDRVRSGDARFLYRQLKKVLKTGQPEEIYNQLLIDLNNLEE